MSMFENEGYRGVPLLQKMAIKHHQAYTIILITCIAKCYLATKYFNL